MEQTQMGIEIQGTEIRYLHDLSGAVVRAGLVARLNTPPGSEPYLRIAHPNVGRLSDTIYCRPRGDDLWFCWSSGDPICVAADLADTVDEIHRVLDARMR
jgi:hypothetical protein